jgi:hypothetical protein
VVALVGVSDSFAGGPTAGETLKTALALVRPVKDTVIVAVPVLEGVKAEVAIPPLAATGDTGANVPLTPLTAKLIVLVAVVTVLPLAS